MFGKNDIIDFSVALATIGGLFFLYFLIPFVGVVFLLSLPIPFLVYRAKNNASKGVLLFVTASLIIILLSYLFGFPGEIITFLFLASLGFFIGEALERGFSVTRILFGGVFLLVVPLFIIWLLTAVQLGESPGSLLERVILANIQEAVRIYKEQGLFLEASEKLSDNAQAVSALIAHIFPSLLVALSLFLVVTNLLLGVLLLRKSLPLSWSIESTYFWRAPEPLVWVLIVSAGVSFFCSYPLLNAVGVNVSIVCLAFYALQGAAIAFCFFRKWRVPIFIRVVFLFILFLQQYFLALIALLGLFDLWFDFRKRVKQQE